MPGDIAGNALLELACWALKDRVVCTTRVKVTGVALETVGEVFVLPHIRPESQLIIPNRVR